MDSGKGKKPNKQAKIVDEKHSRAKKRNEIEKLIESNLNIVDSSKRLRKPPDEMGFYVDSSLFEVEQDEDVPALAKKIKMGQMKRLERENSSGDDSEEWNPEGNIDEDALELMKPKRRSSNHSGQTKLKTARKQSKKQKTFEANEHQKKDKRMERKGRQKLNQEGLPHAVDGMVEEMPMQNFENGYVDEFTIVALDKEDIDNDALQTGIECLDIITKLEKECRQVVEKLSENTGEDYSEVILLEELVELRAVLDEIEKLDFTSPEFFTSYISKYVKIAQSLLGEIKNQIPKEVTAKDILRVSHSLFSLYRQKLF